MDELEITPADVKARLDRGEKLYLVDVREPWEYDLCRIEGAKLVPLGSLAASLQTLPDVDEVICYCHHGMRSLDAAAWLRFQGIEKAKSLAQKIARGPLLAIRAMKKALFASHAKELAHALNNEVEEQIRCYLSEDCDEGIRAFFEKRHPKFQGK